MKDISDFEKFILSGIDFINEYKLINKTSGYNDIHRFLDDNYEYACKKGYRRVVCNRHQESTVLSWFVSSNIHFELGKNIVLNDNVYNIYITK